MSADLVRTTMQSPTARAVTVLPESEQMPLLAGSIDQAAAPVPDPPVKLSVDVGLAEVRVIERLLAFSESSVWVALDTVMVTLSVAIR